MHRLLMLICLVSLSSQDVIHTAQGKLRGAQNNGFISYHGIPYGTIRDAAEKFKQAGLAPSWSGIRESQKVSCTSRSAEECLQLDVHVPTGAGAPWPVLAWVAGGAHYHPARLVQAGVIVVIVHHRFGPLGFLCTNEEQIPGNAGAKDVVSALRWIRDNIVAFRGNPAKVVVAGQSFGAAIVEGLTLSPMADGLIHGAIMQSGTALSPWAFNNDAGERARSLAKMYSDDSMVSSLQKATNKDLADRADRLNSPYFSFGICAEKPFKKTETFLSAQPFELLSNGKVHRVPMMIGFNSDEGYVFAETLNRVKILKKMTRDFNVLLPEEIKFLTEREVQQVKELYFGGKVNMTDVLAYHSDVYFINHVHRSARLHAAASDLPVYYYRFSHSGAVGVEEEPGLAKTGAAHSDELAYLFSDKGRELEGEDGEVQRKLVQLWTSFVKYLKPSSADEPQWTAAEARQPRLLNIDSELAMTDFPHERACRFWDQVDEVVVGGAGAGAGGGARGWPRAPPHRDVLTTQGAARGYLGARPPHFAFLGLPYVSPPTPRDRFKAPRPPASWDGVFEAAHRVRCAQPGRRGAHACLVLNVFAPQHAQAAPVLVHVHGGHFAAGYDRSATWGSHHPPSRLLSRGFVVVTFNYRLGAEGFLCLGTNDVPGNAGLKDQVAALYWVHRNIAKFGGDPNQVSLYGAGAGAASVHLLLLSGAIAGLIHKVILESGSAISPTSLSSDPAATALDIAISLGYQDANIGTVDDLSNFYQEVSPNTLSNVSANFMPCIESASLTNLLHIDPMVILRSGSLEHVPILITYMKEIIDESSLNENTAVVLHTLPDEFEELLPNNLEFDSDDIKIRIGEQIKDVYFGDHILGGDVAESYESYINDVFTVYPIVKSAIMHAASSHLPVYLMEFSLQGGNKTIFDYIFGKDILSDEDELVAEKLVSLWSNFLKYSDPTPLATSMVPFVWQPLSFSVRKEKPDISTASCLIFDLGSGFAMGRPSSSHALIIWDHIYDNFYKFHSPVPT
ncbi:hypothetical protein MSG28_006647 [Choristoneura fumiferana]|uniref:Uncharacterized protein n=1 Tax=Choristoneura fumiferana TaxID=7141 RepID=A0ACC0JKM2_CHOFU|nr:hypothetical protein MSG28_006647 [Choristoneura fumiferana]